MSITTLEPRSLWSNFMSICGIPHKSEHEAALANWLELRAHSLGLAVERDTVGNLIIRKPAGPGCESWPGVILQAHMDMVCQAKAGSSHDFMKDPIRPYIPEDRPEWLVATDTTLGADNGIGVAACLAVLEDPSLRHGPLEVLFTVNEESGMTGARGLSGTALKGRYLLNLDSEELDELCIGCAGALRCTLRLDYPGQGGSAGLGFYRLRVGGLHGGHSGVDINKRRSNANRVLCSLLAGLPEGWCLASLAGGNALNAIPRDAEAILAWPQAGEAGLRAAVEAAGQRLCQDLAQTEPDLAWQLEPSTAADCWLSHADSRRVVDFILGLPDGLQAMETEMPDAIRTSLNLGIFSLAAEAGTGLKLELSIMIRSSSEADKLELAERLEAMATAAGASLERGNSNPAWQPQPESPLAQTASRVYRDCFGKAAKITSTHGGLECGLFRPLYPDWDMLSFGPDIRYPHSPDECVHIPSVGQFWDFLRRLLAALDA